MDNPSVLASDLLHDAGAIDTDRRGSLSDDTASPYVLVDEMTDGSPLNAPAVIAEATPPVENVLLVDEVPRTALDDLVHTVRAGKPTFAVSDSKGPSVSKGKCEPFGNGQYSKFF